MRKSHFFREAIKEHEAGLSTAEVCRKNGLSPATFYKLKAKYGGLEVCDPRLDADQQPAANHRLPRQELPQMTASV